MAYASADDLKVFLKLDSIDGDQAALALELGEAEMDNYLARTYDNVTNAVLEVRGSFDTELRLPGPINELRSVSIDGTEISDFRQLGSTLWRAAGWGGPVVMVAVDLDYGYADETRPLIFKSVILGVAGRGFRNGPTAGAQVQQETLGNYSVTYGIDSDASGGGLTASEKLRLRRWRWGGSNHCVSTSQPRWPVWMSLT